MRFFSSFGVLKLPHCKTYICEVDEERSGNVDAVVESIHCLIDCSLKHAYKKFIAAGRVLLIGGGASFYLWGGHRSRGVAFLSSQKQHFLIKF